MSQLQGGDAVSSTTAVTLTNGAQTTVITGNFVTPPLGTFKAKVIAHVVITLGSIPTNVALVIFRNPNGDNVQVYSSGSITAGVAAGVVITFVAAVTDIVPDGRPVQYRLSVSANGTGTNDVTLAQYIEVILLSG